MTVSCEKNSLIIQVIVKSTLFLHTGKLGRELLCNFIVRVKSTKLCRELLCKRYGKGQINKFVCTQESCAGQFDDLAFKACPTYYINISAQFGYAQRNILI